MDWYQLGLAWLLEHVEGAWREGDEIVVVVDDLTIRLSVPSARGLRGAPRPGEIRVELRAELPDPVQSGASDGYRRDAHVTLRYRPRMCVRPATRTDALARSFGLAVAPATGDPAFDATLWVDHDDPSAHVREVLASPDVRAQCLALARQGAETIRLHHGQVACAADLWLAEVDPSAPGRLRATLVAFAALVRALPRFSGPTGRRSRVSFLMEYAFLPLPLLSFVSAMGSYELHPIEVPTVLQALALGLGAWVAVTPVAYLVARGRTDGGMLFVSTVLPLLIALPALSVVAAIASDALR